jgi:hypothetical protein
VSIGYAAKKNNVSRTISVLVLRVLMYLDNQSVSCIGLPDARTVMNVELEFHGLILQIHQYPEDEDRDGP